MINAHSGVSSEARGISLVLVFIYVHTSCMRAYVQTLFADAILTSICNVKNKKNGTPSKIGTPSFPFPTAFHKTFGYPYKLITANRPLLVTSTLKLINNVSECLQQ